MGEEGPQALGHGLEAGADRAFGFPTKGPVVRVPHAHLPPLSVGPLGPRRG